MRNKVLAYKEKTGFIPDMGIVFCGNRAVVTQRLGGKEAPKFHTEVYFGTFFWLRLMFACMRVWRNIQSTNSTGVVGRLTIKI